jgi:hypothetical protein
MDRDLSSAWTLFYKIIFPSLWIGAFGFAVVSTYLHPERVLFNGVAGAGGPHIWLGFLAGWMLGTFFMVMFCMPLMYVGIENGELLISNYWTDWHVPFSLVSDVKQGDRISFQPIVIQLKENVGCGFTVLFVPRVRTPLTTSSSTREIEELRQLVGLPIGGAVLS